jgi:hypothetical protein
VHIGQEYGSTPNMIHSRRPGHREPEADGEPAVFADGFFGFAMMRFEQVAGAVIGATLLLS